MAWCVRRGISGGASIAEVLKAAKLKAVSGSGKSAGTFGGPATYSFHSYGAQFVEVTWRPEIARLRVSRVVTVIDAGADVESLARRATRLKAPW